jgi:hypothetical protein
VRRARHLRLDASPELMWAVLAAGAWSGPIGFGDAGAQYAGFVRLVEVDEDERVVGCHAQARLIGGWGGVTATAKGRWGRDRVMLDAEVHTSGDATNDAGDALVGALAARVEHAIREAGEPSRPHASAAIRPAPGDRPPQASSPADDPAWRRRLAARAALAVAVGAAAGLVGARLGRRR